jgi:hypothetical protein
MEHHSVPEFCTEINQSLQYFCCRYVMFDFCNIRDSQSGVVRKSVECLSSRVDGLAGDLKRHFPLPGSPIRYEP